MNVQFKTINQNVTAEIVEKKSKFIANLVYVENSEQVEQELEKIRKKFHDAKHHCFAYRIQEENTVIERASDDGEPSGTAGSPMLQLLCKKELVNILVVVTRYFGGTLLGTGGLVRAYTRSNNSSNRTSGNYYKKKRTGFKNSYFLPKFSIFPVLL